MIEEKTVTVWVDSKGDTHPSLRLAKRAEARRALCKAFDDGCFRYDTDFEDLVSFIDEHAKTIAEYVASGQDAEQ